MALWKAGLLDQYDAGKLSAPSNAESFHLTTVIPNAFAKSSGWTEYSFYSSSIDDTTHYDSTAWGGGASVNFGLFSAGGGVASTSEHYKHDFAVSSFSLSMKMTQVVISRPWFYPEFFKNRGWTLRKGEGWFYEDFPSDGGEPAKGPLIAYPTTAIFVKDVVIRSKDFAKAYETEKSSLNANASVSYGPLTLSGYYGHNEGGTKFHSEFDREELRIPGLQLVGFLCHKLGKTPNPLTELKPEDFQ
jgi:hypothetical protein